MSSGWLFGKSGASKVAKLAQELDRKSVARVNEALGSDYLRYEPWMSCSRRLVEFHRLKKTEVCNRARMGSELYLSRATELAALSAVFQSGQDGFAGALGLGSTSSFCVETVETERVTAGRRIYSRAIQRLKSVDQSFDVRIFSLIQQIIPLGVASGQGLRKPEGRGLSSHLYRGGIFLDLPELPNEVQQELEATICLAHELGHQVLMVYQNADEILASPLDQPVFSAIRMTERPAIKSFHAVVVLGAMFEYILKALRHPQKTDAEAAYLKKRMNETSSALKLGLEMLRQAGVHFTALGEQMMRELEEIESRLLLEGSVWFNEVSA